MEIVMILWLLILTVFFGVASNTPLWAQELFYKEKVLRIIVGTPPGTGLDLFSRTIARHMGKHIPGNPTLMVNNMVGAGGLVAATHLYNAVKPDGLTIGMYVGDLPLNQVLGRPGIEVDFLKFGYIGVPLKDFNVCGLTKASGATSIEKWLASKTPVKLGSTAPGTSTDNIPRLYRSLLGLPIQIVTGYKGTPEIRLAAENGEIAGGCWTWGSMRTTWGKAIKSGEVVVVVQNRPQPHPELPTVPLAIDLAKTAEARELVQVGDPSTIIFSYAMPPDSPIERLRTLRRAFMDTMKDPEFLTDTEKSQLAIDPMSGEELEKTVAKLLKLEPALVTKLKEVLTAK
jgi:tripartite-type tricarboxylate transporter receptor subunit TctC